MTKMDAKILKSEVSLNIFIIIYFKIQKYNNVLFSMKKSIIYLLYIYKPIFYASQLSLYSLLLILYFNQTSIIILFYRKTEKIMGCQTSRIGQAQLNKHHKSLRRNKKKVDKIIGKVSDNFKFEQNVIKEEVKLSVKDQAKIQNIISSHFFFSTFSNTERNQMIEQMNIYSCPKDRYIFKQSDPGTLFFIIKKGRVSIYINDKLIKYMEKGQCFGELSLLYTAPRSASVKTQSDCVFWGLHQSIFRGYTQELVKKSYKIAKPFLKKVPLFQFLSQNQINSIAYSMTTLKYKPEQTIFKLGDDANSFYIVIEGSVKIIIKNKDPIILEKGESFGQNSFRRNEVRSGTALAGLTHGTKLLSIGRQGLLKCLGNSIQELIQFNILKWALKRSKIFASIPNDIVKKFIQISEIKQCEDNEIICKSKQPLKYFIVSLEGNVGDDNVGVLVNEQYILQSNKLDKQITIRSNIKKIGKGNVYLLPIKKIQALLQINLIDAARKNIDIFKEYSDDRSGYLAKRKIKARSNMSLNELTYVKNLGEGQFGRVFLVKNKDGQKFALKCIKKKAVVQMGLESMIKNQKQILQNTDHPLIVRLQQTFKDQAFLYLLMQYIDGLDFFDMLRQIGLCNHEVSCFYMACIILSLQQLHSQNIVYRDLKPENAVVDSKGYLYMIDLGTAKKLTQQKGNRTFTIIGTPHYMAPQIMQGKGYGLQVDIWSLGVMLYEMVCGKLPFGEDFDDPYLIYKEIMGQKIQYPSYYFSKRGKSLIEKLLQKNSRKREIEDFSVLKRDPYFSGFKWQQLWDKTLKPPAIPKKKKDSQKRQNTSEIFIVKHLAKDIKDEAVEQETPWDQQF